MSETLLDLISKKCKEKIYCIHNHGLLSKVRNCLQKCLVRKLRYNQAACQSHKSFGSCPHFEANPCYGKLKFENDLINVKLFNKIKIKKTYELKIHRLARPNNQFSVDLSS